MDACSATLDQDGYEEVNGNLIHKTACIQWNHIKVGTGNVFGPFVCIGTPAQHKSHQSEGMITIGNNNVFREFSTVHRPTTVSKQTIIGNNNYFMVNSHIAHDCVLEDDIVMCNNSVLAGHVYVMQGVTVGLGVSVHQWQTIGSYTMIGMNSTINSKSDVVPGKIFAGSPAKGISINEIGLQRNNVSDEILEKEIERFWKIRKK